MTKNETLELILEAINTPNIPAMTLAQVFNIVKHELAQPEQTPVGHSNVAYKLAQKELNGLVEENFGRMPNDEWANSVLDLRDHLEAQQTEKNHA